MTKVSIGKKKFATQIPPNLFFHHRTIPHYLHLLDFLQNSVFSERDYRHQSLPAERIALVEYEIADAVIDRLAVDGVDVLNDVGMMSNY